MKQNLSQKISKSSYSTAILDQGTLLITSVAESQYLVNLRANNDNPDIGDVFVMAKSFRDYQITAIAKSNENSEITEIIFSSIESMVGKQMIKVMRLETNPNKRNQLFQKLIRDDLKHGKEQFLVERSATSHEDDTHIGEFSFGLIIRDHENHIHSAWKGEIKFYHVKLGKTNDKPFTDKTRPEAVNFDYFPNNKKAILMSTKELDQPEIIIRDLHLQKDDLTLTTPALANLGGPKFEENEGITLLT